MAKKRFFFSKKKKKNSVAQVIGKKINLSMIAVKSDVTHIINWIKPIGENRHNNHES